MVYGEYVIEAQARLAARLSELLPPGLGRIYFTNSGAEAIEGALKTARKHTGRASFVAFDGAYHGDTMGALALMGNANFRAPFEPLPGPVRHLPYNDASALSAIDDSVAAVVIEPVQAEGGVRIPSRGFITALRERCSRVGAVLIFDEVLTGFGRTGRLFGLEHFGIVPDIVVLAKALGGGLPLGAFCGPGRIDRQARAQSSARTHHDLRRSSAVLRRGAGRARCSGGRELAAACSARRRRHDRAPQSDGGWERRRRARHRSADRH